ncbi:hypothetical protein ABZP36_035591 [Zizania latifolia]
MHLSPSCGAWREPEQASYGLEPPERAATGAGDAWGEKKVPFIEDFDLELTLATGAGTKQEKPSSSDSGATVSSSNSTESDSEHDD